MSTLTAGQTIPAGTWTLDSVHSSVGFAVKHMVVATFRSRFERLDAALSTVDGQPKLTGTVRVDSIVAKDENLAAHLQSPDFFDAAAYPEITFESTAIRRDGDALTVDGTLTIKGIAQDVVATGAISDPHLDIAGNEKIGITLETTIDRTAHGLDWNAPLPKGGFALANDVHLTVELELARQA
jgi:polyisoprenoid-binding protein YceI